LKILVTGAAGLLGSAVVRAIRRRKHEVVACVRSPEDAGLALDVIDRERVADVVTGTAPDAIVHCAGYTDVDGAETHREEAFEVNVAGARWVARAAADVGSIVLYLGTDYVFDGTASRPYRPGDPPNPVNLYGKSKWMGEEEVRTSGARWIVVRTSWLYGHGGGNFVDAILEAARTEDHLRVVDDQRGRPTWTESLAPALLDLLERDREDESVSDRVFHLADRGEATWYELASEALCLSGVDAELAPVSSEVWDAPAPRPAYSVLDISSAEECLGYPMPDWRESLGRYLASGA